MRSKLEKARGVLRNLYNVEEKDIMTMESRQANKVDARKMYNYYLWKHLGIKHNQMKNYIEGMHHATSIYFKNKMEFELKHYEELKGEWITFLYFIDSEQWRKLSSIQQAKQKYII